MNSRAESPPPGGPAPQPLPPDRAVAKGQRNISNPPSKATAAAADELLLMRGANVGGGCLFGSQRASLGRKSETFSFRLVCALFLGRYLRFGVILRLARWAGLGLFCLQTRSDAGHTCE
jgi:hypothetical protein